MQELFLDSNSHVPMTPKALETFIKVNNSIAGHGHAQSPSIPGRQASNIIEQSRTKIADLLGAQSANQIIFASTCTQACQWATYMFNHAYSYSSSCIVSPAEHPAIKQAVNKYYQNIDSFKLNEYGVIKFDDSIQNRSIICIYIQNEIGVIQPIDRLNCKYLLSDMSQAAGKIPINLSEMNVDVAIFGAHKFGGPTGVSFIYLKDSSIWKEFGTGSRYFMDRTGTPDTPSIAATASALAFAIETMPERTDNQKAFRDAIEAEFGALNINIIGKGANRCPNTTFINIPGGYGIINMLALGDLGIHVGLGSACGSSYTGASPLMTAMGIEGGPHDFIRISQFGWYGKKEAEHFINMFKKVYKNV